MMQRGTWWRWLAIAGVAGALAGAAVPKAEKPPLAHVPLGVANGCFVETVAFLDRWQEAMGGEAWSRLLQWGAREEDEVVAGHAVGLVEARGALWAWDVNFGWSRLPVEVAVKGDAAALAGPVVAKYPRVAPRYPTLRHDFPQPAGRWAPGEAAATSANRSVRDAVRVGEQLGRRRPVNVVRFEHGTGEAKQESAAVVFIFHGRYCVYVPEMGTVPFRVRTSVENLRTIQELLRRGFPGVRGVKALRRG